MTDLFQNPDGANYQARAVLAYLSHRQGIEESWSTEHRRYMANPQVSRWQNCREQGYVIVMRDESGGRQLNIAFFEHRNSDSICAVEWEQLTMNAPTIDTMETGGLIYQNSFDVSHTVGYGQAQQMAEWLMERLVTFWQATRAAQMLATNFSHDV